MANPFVHNKETLKKLPRSTFDLSYQNNGTYQFGKIYPIDIRPVVPGQSVRIKATLGLKSLPMAWPTQTRVKAYVHSFYVRNRNLWRDWPEFIQGTNDVREDGHKKDIRFPYLGNVTTEMLRTGSFLDYCGVPTTTSNSSTTDFVFSFQDWHNDRVVRHSREIPIGSTAKETQHISQLRPVLIFSNAQGAEHARIGYVSVDMSKYCHGLSLNEKVGSSILNILRFRVAVNNDSNYTASKNMKATLWKIKKGFIASSTAVSQSEQDLIIGLGDASSKIIETNYINSSPSVSNGYIDIDFPLLNNITFEEGFEYRLAITCARNQTNPAFPLTLANTMYNPAFGSIVVANQILLGYVDAVDVSQSPFQKINGKTAIHLNALPMRAYESCCNCYMRNDQIDPYYSYEDDPNGIKEFNKYCNTKGGADMFKYDFHYRNFEYDFLTSCLPSPQMGDAPLVGMSMRGAKGENEVSFTFHEPDDPDGKIYTAKGKITGGQVSSFDITSEDMPKDLKSIIMSATSGISIRDMRNANALQKYLEVMIKNGYKYRDYLRSIHGVEPDLATLDMPEFIGGYTTQMVINPITQQVADEESPVGSLKANAFMTGQSDNFTKYCDEHGFIVTTLCIMPMASYTQLLPKHMLVPVNELDYANPAMMNIGPQPVSFREVCPIERFKESLIDRDKKVTDTFGYNRAWYDLVTSYDVVHGDLRKSLSGYVINRQFDGSPELSKSFIKYEKGCVNTPFVDTTEQDDVFIGQIWFDIKVKLPMSAVDITKLG